MSKEINEMKNRLDKIERSLRHMGNIIQEQFYIHRLDVSSNSIEDVQRILCSIGKILNDQI